MGVETDSRSILLQPRGGTLDLKQMNKAITVCSDRGSPEGLGEGQTGLADTAGRQPHCVSFLVLFIVAAKTRKLIRGGRRFASLDGLSVLYLLSETPCRLLAVISSRAGLNEMR